MVNSRATSVQKQTSTSFFIFKGTFDQKSQKRNNILEVTVDISLGFVGRETGFFRWFNQTFLTGILSLERGTNTYQCILQSENADILSEETVSHPPRKNFWYITSENHFCLREMLSVIHYLKELYLP